MSKVYGTLISDKGTSTRAGHRYIKACAQSFNGSVICSIDAEGNYTVELGAGSTEYGMRLIATGNVNEQLKEPLI